MIPGFEITPWLVKGDRVDYRKVLSYFNLRPITPDVRNMMRDAFGDVNYLVRRGLFFAHREMRQALLDLKYRRRRVYLFTGRGASGPMHIGHLVPLLLARWMQRRRNLTLIFQISDDEKFVLRPKFTLEQVRVFARDNALDFLALGFDPDRTKIIWDTMVASWLYPLTLKVAKHVKISELKTVVKIDDSWNVGIAFYIAVQSLPALMYELEVAFPVRSIVPMAVDQDPILRVAQRLADRLGLTKPALIHSRFLPGLRGEPKMGASNPKSAIFLTDGPEEVKEKVEGSSCGPPEICPSVQYLKVFEEDDHVFYSVWEQCLKDRVQGCDLAKRKLLDILIPFMEEHQRLRREYQDKVDEFLMKEPPKMEDLGEGLLPPHH